MFITIDSSQIEMDFERLYPEATKNFYNRFPLLHQKLTKFIENAVAKDKAHKLLFDEYNNTTDGQQKDYLLCMLLPIIIQTNYRVKGNYKPSVKESQDSFILEVQVSCTHYSNPTPLKNQIIFKDNFL